MTDSVDEQTLRFANGLTHTVRAVTVEAPEFQVNVAGNDPWFATVRPEDEAAINLTIGGRCLLDLTVSFQCTLSQKHPYMLIERSQFGLRPHGGGEWLVRLDYEHHPAGNLPCSHLHVHAHRDAWTFLMTRDGKGSQRRAVRRRGAADKTPHVSDVHFPAGGPRLRPTLEDFLIMTIQDLGVDHTPNAMEALTQARADWRLEQTKSIVASSQDTAADVLRGLGWSVTPPDGYEPKPALPDWLYRY
ncbi:hypothetical protein DRB06_13660 [Actinomyces sp. Z5]|uniref:hypothetical protein n=1 Tax=Actinomyces sp. Z5 TaxID=2250216 RepID=UPI000DCBC575|nr:hypothetical protein [Actinomyces sp. Z5]RAX19280.1 hypothetical protein DRB06_13660 [Actinomyces sp. Z5]